MAKSSSMPSLSYLFGGKKYSPAMAKINQPGWSVVEVKACLNLGISWSFDIWHDQTCGSGAKYQGWIRGWWEYVEIVKWLQQCRTGCELELAPKVSFKDSHKEKKDLLYSEVFRMEKKKNLLGCSCILPRGTNETGRQSQTIMIPS